MFCLIVHLLEPYSLKASGRPDGEMSARLVVEWPKIIVWKTFVGGEVFYFTNTTLLVYQVRNSFAFVFVVVLI